MFITCKDTLLKARLFKTDPQATCRSFLQVKSSSRSFIDLWKIKFSWEIVFRDHLSSENGVSLGQLKPTPDSIKLTNCDQRSTCWGYHESSSLFLPNTIFRFLLSVPVPVAFTDSPSHHILRNQSSKDNIWSAVTLPRL